MQSPGWILILTGVVIIAVGAVWLLAPSVPWLGRLPGDVVIQRGNSRIFIPITTCILLSLLLTAVMSLVHWMSR